MGAISSPGYEQGYAGYQQPGHDQGYAGYQQPGYDQGYGGYQQPGGQTPWDTPHPYYGAYAPRRAPGFPDGLKVLAVTMSVLKAIPLLISAALLLLLLAFAQGVDQSFPGEGLFVFVGAFAAVGLAFFGLGAALLFFQIRGALKSQFLTLAIVSGIMTAIDALWFLLSFVPEFQAPSAVLYGMVLAGQGGVFLWTLTSRKQVVG